MVVKRQCSFCAREIEPGTGTMFVKRDGTVFHFCSSSCRKQQLDLGRVGHRFKWTRAHELKRAADRSTAQKAPAAPAPSKPGGARAPRRPAPAAPKATAQAEPAQPPAPAAETPTPAPTAHETPTSTEAPATKPAAKPRRSRKKAEPAASE
jgi:large subunit ribosomal protein L24e